ncbi:MAG TPA: phosphoenolpyruvate-utilizing N-terminal domain-containing protein, partial [Acetobacteraceae bacterium]|nr:phosphoenolpyruvate-utilizing N-terminal domain-containing protein [Acetobacteraceae bacterium]
MSRTDPPPPQHQRLPARLARAPDRAEAAFYGIPVSPGVAIGAVFGTAEPTPEIGRTKIQAADAPGEGARLDAAIAQSRKQLLKLKIRLAVLPEDSQA